ncbi:MAG: biotin--[acetyl-CoA-carboxylase] ligase [Pseudomonadota bacterium]
MDKMLPGGSRLRELAETDSTNTECLDAAMAGDPGRLWIRARMQTEARGSRGRGWTSYEGNLFASYLLLPRAPTGSLGQITFVAALAVYDALMQQIAAQGAELKVELKWPNDVLLAGRKICGILLESHEISGERIVIVGIGLNCFSHPRQTAFPATSLMEHGINASAAEMLSRIIPTMDHWLEIWRRGQDFQYIREAWTSRAKGIGKRIAAKLHDRETIGIFEAIDDAGRLTLRKNDGSKELISVADVFYLNSAKTG